VGRDVVSNEWRQIPHIHELFVPVANEVAGGPSDGSGIIVLTLVEEMGDGAAW
jgi:hypothetical protein